MQFFQEWREADRVAFAAERLVFSATMRLIDGGSAPPERDIAESHRLRAIADDLFVAAMEEIGGLGQR